MSKLPSEPAATNRDAGLSFLLDGPRSAQVHVLFAHGAGAPMTSPWMMDMATALAREGLCVHRFNFSYMAARCHGSRRPPPKAVTLIPQFVMAAETVRADLRPDQILIAGGKSMGGRVASMAIDALSGRGVAQALAAVSYPFHPPKKPAALRVAHLETLRTPALIVQGERDPLGDRDEVGALVLPPTLAMHWILDGNHDLKGRSSKVPRDYDAFADAAGAVALFAADLRRRK